MTFCSVDDAFTFRCNWYIYFSAFDVTTGSFDGAELCKLVGIYIHSLLTKLINKETLGLYRDDGLTTL